MTIVPLLHQTIAPQPQDVAHLVSELPNLAISQRIAWDKFNHLDFMWCVLYVLIVCSS